MKRIPFLLLGLWVAAACTDTTTEPEPLDLAVSFGVEPSPFFPSATNAMEAVVQHLMVIGGDFESLSHPPDPCVPPEPCLPDPALIGKLGAMTNELGMINEQVAPLLAFPPDPVTPDQVAALASAAGEAYLAAGSIRSGVPPDPITPEVREAFGAVTNAAGVIQETIAGSEFCRFAAGAIGVNRCT